MRRRAITSSVTALNISSENAIIKFNKSHSHSDVMSQSVIRNITALNISLENALIELNSHSDVISQSVMRTLIQS